MSSHFKFKKNSVFRFAFFTLAIAFAFFAGSSEFQFSGQSDETAFQQAFSPVDFDFAAAFQGLEKQPSSSQEGNKFQFTSFGEKKQPSFGQGRIFTFRGQKFFVAPIND